MPDPVRPPLRATVALAGLLALLAGCGGGGQDTATTLSRDISARLAAGAIHLGVVDPGERACRPLLGEGWHAPEQAPDGHGYAWTSARRARLRLPVDAPGAGTLRLAGYGLPGPEGPRRLEIRVNGASLGERELPARPGVVAWDVPEHRLRAGVNELELRVDRTVSPEELGLSGDTRQLGVLVDWVAFTPEGSTAAGNPYRKDPPDAGPSLAPDRVLTTRLAHGAGAELDLEWPADGPAPQVAVSAAPGGRALFAVDLADSAGAARVALPQDLPAGAWLAVRGESGTLEAARLERRVRACDVVLIIVDTLRPDYLGCYGAGPGASPAIDALAADGILFREAFAHAPMTGPSHASLFTSRLPSETGVTINARVPLPAALPTLPEILREAGWATAAAVAIGPIVRQYGFARGFDAYDDRMEDLWILPGDTMAGRFAEVRRGRGRPSFLFAHLADPHEPYDAHGLVERTASVRLDGRELAVLPTSTYVPSVLVLDVPAGEHALTVTSDEPFNVRNFATSVLEGEVTVTADREGWKTWHEVTVPVASPAGGRLRLVLGLSDVVGGTAQLRERYAREVAWADRWVGALLDSLRAAGTYDESLIVFAADHGESLDEHGIRGHVENLHDPMTRVPLIVKPPRGAGLPAGSRRDDLAGLVDVLPTVLAHVGLPPLPGARGRDLLAPGAAGADVALFMETHRPEAERTLYGLRTATARVVYAADTDTWEYYDLVADPGAERDTAAARSAAFARDRDRLLGILGGLRVAGRTAAGEVAVDPRTAEMLRSLGY